MEKKVGLPAVSLVGCDSHTVHFSGWKLICHLDSQSSRAVRSSCNLVESQSLAMYLYKSVSSANKLAFDDLQTVGRSLM